MNVLYVWPESGIVRWWLVKEEDGKKEMVSSDSFYSEDVMKMTASDIEGEKRLTRGNAFFPVVERIKDTLSDKVHMVRVDQYDFRMTSTELPDIPLERVAQMLNRFDWTYRRHKDMKAWSDTRHEYIRIRLYLENMTGDELKKVEKLLDLKTIQEPSFHKYYSKYFGI